MLVIGLSGPDALKQSNRYTNEIYVRIKGTLRDVRHAWNASNLEFTSERSEGHEKRHHFAVIR